MRAPQITFAMIRHIDLNHNDPHAVVKALNQVIEDKYNSDNGKCPHRPANLVSTISGDSSHKATGSFCVFCAEEIEIEKIVWKKKGPIPNPPRVA